MVTFTGVGYDDRVMGNTLSLGGHIDGIPSRQNASVGAQVSLRCSLVLIHHKRLPSDTNDIFENQ